MPVLEILTYPAPFLSKPAKRVGRITREIEKLISDMTETLYSAPGLGLAAVQVGSDKSVLIYDIIEEEKRKGLTALINPNLVAREGEIISPNEGCLSVPEFRADVPRFARVSVEGLDRTGKPVHIDAEGLLAIVLQHEIDHLNGILFIDRISSLKREIYRRHRKKQLKREKEQAS